MITLICRTANLLRCHSTIEYFLHETVCSPVTIMRCIHVCNHMLKNKDEKEERSLVTHVFNTVQRKDKQTFLEIIQQYIDGNPTRRGHVEFIYVALKYMKDFGVHEDLESYKKLLDVLPKGRFVPRNKFQEMLFHFPKQQYAATEVLTKMDENGVIPDRQMQKTLLDTFGTQGMPLRKYWRMMYWMPKFANINPWPVPRPLPNDPRELARLAINKISTIEPLVKISEYETKDVPDSVDDTWIISSMSILQKELLQVHPVKTPIYVEGPFTVWVGTATVNYFVLRADLIKRNWKEKQHPDDVSNIEIPFWDKKELMPLRTVHEQDDRIIFSTCATGTSSKDSLLSWIRCLQKDIEVLKIIPIVFKIGSSSKQNIRIDGGEMQPTQGLLDQTDEEKFEKK